MPALQLTSQRESLGQDPRPGSSGGQPRYAVVFNARSGNAAGITPAELGRLAVGHGLDLRVDARFDLALDQRMREAAAGDADILVAAGGDGTATAAAVAARAAGKPMAVLPLGTANLLAHDLRLPMTPEEWLAALPAFEPKRIDAAEVNGRLFLHKVVLGAILETAAMREAIRDEAGLAAGFRFFVDFCRRLATTSRFAVEIAPRGGGRRVEVVEALAVANNDYDEGFGRFFSRERLDRGTLSIYLLPRLNMIHAVRLAAEMLLGRWRRDSAVEIESVEAVAIRTSRPRVRAMVDGEIGVLETPLHFRILPAAVTVLAPPPAPRHDQEQRGDG